MLAATFDRRRFLAYGAVAAAVSFTRKAIAERRIVMNDASRLNPTPVFRHWQPKSDPTDALIDDLRRELKDAAAAGRPVVVGAARHSMGAQSLARDGIAVTFD